MRVPGVLDLVRSAGRMLALCLIRAVARAVFLEGHQRTELLDGKRRGALGRAVRVSEGGGEARSGVASDKLRGEWRAATRGLRCAASETHALLIGLHRGY